LGFLSSFQQERLENEMEIKKVKEEPLQQAQGKDALV
jgi:hypothetical protein